MHIGSRENKNYVVNEASFPFSVSAQNKETALSVFLEITVNVCKNLQHSTVLFYKQVLIYWQDREH